MSTPFSTNNPGIGGLDELTVAEESLLEALVSGGITGVLDEDDLTSNSDTDLATQQSIKAYVDSQVGGATTALDNLASVAINTSLVSDTHNTDDLGTDAIAWRTAYLSTSLVFDQTTRNVTIVATEPATSARTYTIPDFGANDSFVALAATQTLTNKTIAFGSNTLTGVQAQGDVLDDLNTLGAASSDGEFIVATGAGVFAYESGATARASLGLGSAAIVATDLSDLNEATIEAAIDTLANLTSVQGLTVTLADAGANAIFGWDDAAGAYENLTQAEVLAVIGDASTSAKGVVELATTTETNTGTDTARAVTPDGLSSAVKTIMLTAQGGAPLTTAGCSEPTKVEAATNDINYWVLDFDATTEEHAFWTFPMPQNWDAGTVNATFYWTNASGLTTETVDWGIAGVCISNDEEIDSALGTEVTTTDTWIAQGDLHISSESTAVTIANAVAGELVSIVVARKVASDDLTGDARLIAVKLTYTINQYSDEV